MALGGTSQDEKPRDGFQSMSNPDKEQVGIRSEGYVGKGE
jgi:hypothetical protein